MSEPLELLTVGRVVGVFGIKGWVKVKSYTQPEARIMDYQPWHLQTPRGVTRVALAEHQFAAKGLMVRFAEVDDRNLAETYVHSDIAVSKGVLPALQEEDFYWHQLIGLRVIHLAEQESVVLGEVQSLLETGANDVLVVVPCSGSVDQRERLVPYVFDTYVRRVDLQRGVIEVDWDPAY